MSSFVAFCFFVGMTLAKVTNTPTKLDPKVTLALSTLPSELRLTAAVLPGTDATTCNGFWFKTGYVCDKDKTIAFVKKDLATLATEEKKFNTVINLYLEALNLAEIDAHSLLSGDQHQNAERSATRVEELRGRAGRCWKLIASTRAGSPCTTCAATNSLYYKGKLLAISGQDCRQFVAVCTPLFNQLLILARKASRLFSTIVKTKNPDSKYQAEFGPDSARMRQAESLLEFHISQRDMEDANRPEEATRARALICENLFAIHKPPALYKLVAYLDGAVRAFLSEYLGRKLSTAAASRSRQLPLASASGLGLGPGEPEVWVATSDNVFDSQLPVTDDHAQPANLTLALF